MAIGNLVTHIPSYEVLCVLGPRPCSSGRRSLCSTRLDHYLPLYSLLLASAGLDVLRFPFFFMFRIPSSAEITFFLAQCFVPLVAVCFSVP
jgi:hypothetical protein